MSDNKINNKIWWTMKSRIRAEKRLLANDFHGQFMLMYYSFFGTASAIYYLVFETSSKYMSAVWVVYSVFILCISALTNGWNYRQRADSMKQCHLVLKDLIENTNRLSSEKVLEHYSEILKTNENHATIDLDVTIWESILRREEIDKKATFYLKCKVISYYFCRILSLLFLYCIPILLLLISVFWK